MKGLPLTRLYHNLFGYVGSRKEFGSKKKRKGLGVKGTTKAIYKWVIHPSIHPSIIALLFIYAPTPTINQSYPCYNFPLTPLIT